VAALLFRVSPSDPPVFLAVGATLIAVAVVASLVPGWRAARVDPTVALRSD
jgi:putative ABC transport system permease protein